MSQQVYAAARAAARRVTSVRVEVVAAQYRAWLEAQGDESAAVGALQAASGASKSPDRVIAAAAELYEEYDPLPSSAGGEGSLLSGQGPPPSGSGLDPIDPALDPWRTSPFWAWAPGGYFLGPLYEVTWDAGDVLFPALTAVEQDALGIALEVTYFSSGSTIRDISEESGLLHGRTYSPGNPDAAAITASEAGSGIWHMKQITFGGTYVFNQAVDPLLLMSPEVTVVGPYEVSEEMVGQDGQWYIDLNTRDFYGPRSDGAWVKFGTLPA
jgi:hypothetical protein